MEAPGGPRTAGSLNGTPIGQDHPSAARPRGGRAQGPIMPRTNENQAQHAVGGLNRPPTGDRAGGPRGVLPAGGQERPHERPLCLQALGRGFAGRGPLPPWGPVRSPPSSRSGSPTTARREGQNPLRHDYSFQRAYAVDGPLARRRCGPRCTGTAHRGRDAGPALPSSCGRLEADAGRVPQAAHGGQLWQVHRHGAAGSPRVVGSTNAAASVESSAVTPCAPRRAAVAVRRGATGPDGSSRRGRGASSPGRAW